MEQSSSWKRVFGVFWAAQASSLFGSSLVQFALIWWLAERTGSATVLAFATLAAMLPGIIVGPFAGVLVDRWDRRVLMAASDTASALVAVVFALLFWSGQIDTWHIYLGMAIRSLANFVQMPAEQASTALMVPEAQLARVAGLNQLLQGLMMIAAPPLGALLIRVVPFEHVMLVDVGTGAIAVVLVLCIRIPRPAQRDGVQASASFGQEFVDGLRYVARWPGLRQLILMGAVVNLLIIPVFTLLPLLVTRFFGGSELELAWINMVFGIGYVTGSVLLSLWGGFRRRIVTSLVGLVGMGVGTLALGLTPTAGFPLALGAMAIIGISFPIRNGPVMAILQSVVAPKMQGRVFTVMNSLLSVVSPVGLLLGGPAADQFGIKTLYVTSGLVCLLISVVAALSNVLLSIEEHHIPILTEALAIEPSL